MLLRTLLGVPQKLVDPGTVFWNKNLIFGDVVGSFYCMCGMLTTIPLTLAEVLTGAYLRVNKVDIML
jgi:hypothetical protein